MKKHKHDFGVWHCRGGSPQMIRACLVGECLAYMGMDGKVRQPKKVKATSKDL